MSGSARTAPEGRTAWAVALWLLALANPAAAAPPAEWTSWRHDADNAGAVRLPEAAGRNGTPWTFRLPHHRWGYRPGMTVWSTPAVGEVDGRAVVAVGACDHNLYLLDAATGAQLWRFTTGNGIYDAPLIWHGGGRSWVFAASADRVLYAVDARSGRRVWSHALAEFQPTSGGARLSAPTLGRVGARPVLFVGHWVWDKSLARSTQRGGLSAVDAETGQRLWQVDFLDNRVSAPVFARIGERDLVFAASEDGNLRALAAEDGRILWTHRETEPIMASPLVLADTAPPRLIIGSHFGKLRCLDAGSGRELWSIKTGNWITAAASRVRDGGRDLIVFGGYDRRVWAVDALDGRRIWTQQLAGPVYSAPAIVARGEEPVAVVAAWDHHLHGLSLRDGTLLFSVFTGAPLWEGIVLGESNWASPSAAALGQRWMIYHGGYDGTLYAIPLSQALQSFGSQPWSSLRFWLIMLGVLIAVATLALLLTHRRRAQIRAAQAGGP